MSNEVKATEKKSLVAKFADKYNLEANKLMGTLKDTAFKQKEGVIITDSQMAALLIVADQHNLNPFTKEIYAYPDKNNGIVPVVGVDGWARIANEHPQMDGFHFIESDQMVESDEHKFCPAWMEITIFKKGSKHPVIIKEYFDEVYRPPFKGTGRNGSYEVKGPWQSHTKRMLRHKTLIQGLRYAFSFSGIYDQDEAERIIEGQDPS
jgi:phage recombination protein Bet